MQPAASKQQPTRKMMKRIPKGTLKVTTSSLDDQEPHQRSTSSSSSKRGSSSRSLSSFASPVRARSPLPVPPTSAAALITPTSPPSTSAAAHTFHFLRRPFGGGIHHHHGGGGSQGGSLKGGRRRNKNNRASHQPPPHEQPPKRSSGTSDTGVSSSNSNTTTSSGNSNSNRSCDIVQGVQRLGIAAPPRAAILTAAALADEHSDDSDARSSHTSSPIPSLDGNDTTDSSDGGFGLVAAPTMPTTKALSSSLPLSDNPPEVSKEENEASPQPKAPRSPPGTENSPAVLGIQRPNYYGCDSDDRINDSLDDGHRWGDDVDFEELDEEESEIVFETSCDPIDAETSTLFEQSWLSETGDLHPVANPSSLDLPSGSPPPPSKTLEKARPSRRAARLSTNPPPLPPPSVRNATVDAIAATTTSVTTRTQPPSTTLPTKKTVSGGGFFVQPSPILRSTASVPVSSPHAKACAASLSDSVRVFVLLLQPHNKVFELIQLTYPVETTTIGDILAMIPPHATEPILAAQNYVGLTRPKKRAPDWCDESLPASYSAKMNGHSAGFEDGNVVVALPSGYAHAELVRLAKKILSNDRIRSLLERSTLSSSGRSAATKRHSIERPRHSKHRHHERTTTTTDREDPHHRSSSSPSSSESPSSSGSDDTEPRRRALSPTPLTSGHVAASRAAYEAGIQRAVAHASRANAAVVRPVPAKIKTAQDASKTRRTVDAPTASTPSSSTTATNVEPPSAQLPTPEPSSSSSSATASVSSTSQSTATTSALRRRDHHATFQEAFAAVASPSLSRTRSMRRPRLSHHTTEATQPQQPPFLEPSSSSTSVASSVSSLSAVQRARNSPHKKPIFKDTPKSLLDSEASDAASGDGSAHSQWSRRRTGQQQGTTTSASLPRLPHRRSFAPLSLSHSRASVHPARSKRPRSAAAAASFGRAAALLALTMVIRYYTDPHGYAASQLLHHREQHTGWAVDPLETYDRPLGLLGGLQLFLLLHLLLKFQQGYPGGGGASSDTAGTTSATLSSSSSTPPPSPSWQRLTRRNPSSSASVGSRSLCV